MASGSDGSEGSEAAEVVDAGIGGGMAALERFWAFVLEDYSTEAESSSPEHCIPRSTCSEYRLVTLCIRLAPQAWEM
jgi:hypothetical protein